MTPPQTMTGKIGLLLLLPVMFSLMFTPAFAQADDSPPPGAEGPSVEDKGPPQERGPPEDAGKPEDAGPPDGEGPSVEDKGPPQERGPPENAGPPDGEGPSVEDKGPPQERGPPEDTGKPQDPDDTVSEFGGAQVDTSSDTAADIRATPPGRGGPVTQQSIGPFMPGPSPEQKQQNIMDSEQATSYYGKQGYAISGKSVGTDLLKTNTGKICGLSLCDEKLSMEQKIELYLKSLGLK